MIELIPAHKEDYSLIYDCRFHPDHIRVSLTHNKPTRADSYKWLDNHLDEHKIIFVDNTKAGYVRICPDKSVHISILPEFRGKGVGSKALSLTKGWTYILDINPGSIRAFEKAGYKKIGVLMQK